MIKKIISPFTLLLPGYTLHVPTGHYIHAQTKKVARNNVSLFDRSLDFYRGQATNTSSYFIFRQRLARNDGQ
jgi:hypothetical protein